MPRYRDRAVEFTGPEAGAVGELDRPEPGPDEVVVRTAVSAVSAGTELLVYRGAVDDGAPADVNLPALDGRLDFPLPSGYAAVGTVTEVGERVDPDWRGETVFGFSPHRSTFRAKPEDLVVVPSEVDPERAALFASAETAVTFALDGAPRLGERVAIFGQGVVGLLTTAVLARTGVETILAVEPVRRRRAIAESMGADVTIDPTRRDPVEAIRSETASEGIDLAIEVSGRPSVLEDAVEATRFDGRVLVGSWYGTRREPIGLDSHFHRGRIRIDSSQVSTIDPALGGRWDRDRRREVALSQLGEIDVSKSITHRIPVTDAPRAYELLATRPGEAIQVLFTYE